MTPFQFVSDHLWQSTLVAGVVALAILALRRKRASVRYALWWAASVKFLLPFAGLSAVGAAIGARLPLRVPALTPDVLQSAAGLTVLGGGAHGVPAVVQSSGASSAVIPLAVAIGAVWIAGCMAVLAAWTVRWSRAAAAVGRATPLTAGREVDILRRLEASMAPNWRALPIRITGATIEPGVHGAFRPTLLWPRRMSEHLSDEQIETIFVHELVHIRRRDNLTAMAHNLVQAVCWFHPLVWWIGARLVDERERACDEAVVGAGRDRRVYAESLLKTCQFCVGAPVTNMAGVTGSDLKRRVASIMAAPLGRRLGVRERLALILAAAAVVAVPVIGGASRVAQMTESGLSVPDGTHVFEAASVRQNTSGDHGGGGKSGDLHMSYRNMSLKRMLLLSFRPVQESQLIGGPGWMDTDTFDLVAKAPAGTSDPDLYLMLRQLLFDRFAIKAHVETRNLPIYALTLARGDGQLGPELRPAQCEKYTTGQPCTPAGASQGRGHAETGGGGGVVNVGAGGGPNSGGRGASMSATGITMPALATMLSGYLGRVVVDRTGLAGRFEMKLAYSQPRPPGLDAPEQTAPEIFTAVQEQLGLKLEATRGPVQVLVIDSAAHPVNDDFVMPEPTSK